jgi:selenocysteine lyase/cysteine desulfurase
MLNPSPPSMIATAPDRSAWRENSPTLDQKIPARPLIYFDNAAAS